MSDSLKVQLEIQKDVNKALLTGDYSLIFDALKRVNQEVAKEYENIDK